MASRVEQVRPGCWLIRAAVRNVSGRPLTLREIVPLSIDAEWGGRLEFGSMPAAWTVFGMADTVTDGCGVYDLGVWRVDAIKNDFYMADYMVAGDRRNRKYLTLGAPAVRPAAWRVPAAFRRGGLQPGLPARRLRV